MTDKTIPKDFLWRRLHSFAGLWLVIFIIFHLLTNAQAALPIGDDGMGFIKAVNAIHETPFLPLIEIAILALPILIHMIWGIKYLRSAEYNSFGDTGHTPYLPEYPRNHAYTWQRITSWILVFGIIAHVIHMRFIEYPTFATKGHQHTYMVRVTLDDGIYTLADRLGVKLYGIEAIKKQRMNSVGVDMKLKLISEHDDMHIQKDLQKQELEQELRWEAVLEKHELKPGEAIAVANSFGAAELLMVRDTFKMPLMIGLYTLLVLAACFHAFNGLWTFMISWGVTLTERSQRIMRWVTTAFMFGVGFLGLAAVWMTYWINLKG